MKRKEDILEPAPELLEASGSTEQYHIDMQNFMERTNRKIAQLKKTKAGREKLRKAGFGKVNLPNGSKK